MGKDIDYNIWHGSHSIDDVTNTPWHNFAKDNLRNLELDHSMILEIGYGRRGFSYYMACQNYFNPFGIWSLYRWLIAKPFTEGGQPEEIYYFIEVVGLKIIAWDSSEIIPARIPKHFWNARVWLLLKPLGYRTFYVLKKHLEKH